MKLFTDHRLTIAAGFLLAAALIGAGIAHGGAVPDIFDLARWGHFLAGITWVGLLYYFNLVQVPSLASVSAETKTELFREGGLARRALWWFRWAAMLTLIFGGILYMHLAKTGAEGVDIRIGATLAIIMWFNVWFIIWPARPDRQPHQRAAVDPDAVLHGLQRPFPHLRLTGDRMRTDALSDTRIIEAWSNNARP
ncbi:MAG TPA: hypothetical protein VNH42_03420, partial [Mariprofundaceae bacterium]|nr:hypothetical protein [Mariprofundaceae bacterium]